jgi:hypothetical protein
VPGKIHPQNLKATAAPEGAADFLLSEELAQTLQNIAASQWWPGFDFPGPAWYHG